MSWWSQLDPRFAPYARYLFDVAQANHLAPVVTSTYRSYTTQARLYAEYVAGNRDLPAAPPGRSKHQYGLAVDIDLPQYRAYLPALGAFWRTMGGRWFPSDPVHFEAP